MPPHVPKYKEYSGATTEGRDQSTELKEKYIELAYCKHWFFYIHI